MPHIELPNLPGIRSLVTYRPETGKHLYELAQVLLRGESPLAPAERELIASYVSYRNECNFCFKSHAAATACLMDTDISSVENICKDLGAASVSPKIKALLHIAGKVQVLGKEVKPEDIQAARDAGAGDRDIHDTVLIAASFSMFNRYVDGLATLTPQLEADYMAMGERMTTLGYVLPTVTPQVQ